MKLAIKKITLKGHNSFYLREGWLNKIFLHQEENYDFLRDTVNGAVVLGVGSGMVKAIKFYLVAMDLINLLSKNNPTTKLFETIKERDPYLEDLFTKYILHYKLISNADKATTWHTYFNYINIDEISRDDTFSAIQNIYHEALPGVTFSQKSLIDDISVLIKLYTRQNDRRLTPEDNLQSPLSDLKLMEFDGKYLKKTSPPQDLLSDDVVFYILLSELEKFDNDNEANEYNVSIDTTMSAPNNIGRVLNLTKEEVYKCLLRLQDRKKLVLQQTAGLDQIYINKSESSESVLDEHLGVNNVQR
jgi:hypothetical protein